MMFVKIQFITRNISIISLTFWLLFETCQCLPQLQGGVRNINNDFRGQEGRQNNNRNSITTNRPPNRGQRVLEGGFVPSDFGNELRNVKFPGKMIFIRLYIATIHNEELQKAGGLRLVN